MLVSQSEFETGRYEVRVDGRLMQQVLLADTETGRCVIMSTDMQGNPRPNTDPGSPFSIEAIEIKGAVTVVDQVAAAGHQEAHPDQYQDQYCCGVTSPAPDWGSGPGDPCMPCVQATLPALELSPLGASPSSTMDDVVPEAVAEPERETTTAAALFGALTGNSAIVKATGQPFDESQFMQFWNERFVTPAPASNLVLSSWGNPVEVKLRRFGMKIELSDECIGLNDWYAPYQEAMTRALVNQRERRIAGVFGVAEPEEVPWSPRWMDAPFHPVFDKLVLVSDPEALFSFVVSYDEKLLAGTWVLGAYRPVDDSLEVELRQVEPGTYDRTGESWRGRIVNPQFALNLCRQDGPPAADPEPWRTSLTFTATLGQGALAKQEHWSVVSDLLVGLTDGGAPEDEDPEDEGSED